MIKRDLTEVVFEILNEIPGFKKDELLEYTKWAIQRLYYSLKNGEEIKVKCKSELINKLNKEKVKYKIDKNIDHISIQYVELYDSIKKDDEMYIQVYVSVYFHDDVENNVCEYSMDDKYWNEIWIVTYRANSKSDTRKNSNCINCGAAMQYRRLKDTFECEYCGNTIQNDTNSIWEIVDIELQEQ